MSEYLIFEVVGAILALIVAVGFILGLLLLIDSFYSNNPEYINQAEKECTSKGYNYDSISKLVFFPGYLVYCSDLPYTKETNSYHKINCEFNLTKTETGWIVENVDKCGGWK